MGCTRALCYAAAVIFVAPANAQDITTGNGFLATCGDGAASVSAKIRCLEYLQALHDGATTALIAAKANQVYCIPAGVTFEQMKDVLIADIRRFPALRHHEIAVQFISAMKEAFPCAK